MPCPVNRKLGESGFVSKGSRRRSEGMFGCFGYGRALAADRVLERLTEPLRVCSLCVVVGHFR